MTNKNRKRRIQGFVIPMPAVTVLVVAMVLLLAYIGLDVRSKALGAGIKALEQQRAELQKSYDLELWKWEKMKSPANIEKMLCQNDCAMIWPAEVNIIRLREPAAAASGMTDYKPQLAQISRSGRPVFHD